MKYEQGFLEGLRGQQIYYQTWQPEGATKAILLVVHGLAEHSGRYMNVVHHFVPRGYAVYGIDHLGHGKSPGTRVFVEQFEDYIIPLKQYFDQIQRWQPGKPIFLIGHSMGGLIGARYLLQYQHELAGAVLSGPLAKISENISPGLILMGKVLSKLSPKAGVTQLDAAGISRDPAVVAAYVNDPLVYTGKITARLSAELLKTVQLVASQASQITLPLLIVQGSQDKLVDPRGAQELYARTGSADKTLKMYEGFYHEVFNEPERNQVLGDVEQWLEKHLPAA